MIRKFALILAGTAALVLVVAGGALAFLVWRPDVLKPTLERLATEQLGREVRLSGPLRIDPGRVTAVEAEGLWIAAPEWAASDHLLKVDRLRAAIDLGTLATERRVHLTEVTLEGTDAALERDPQGRTSWPSSPAEAAEVEPAAEPVQEAGGGGLPQLDQLRIERARVGYRDAVTAVDVAATVASTADQGLKIEGEGSVRGAPLRLDVEAGSPVAATLEGAPLPLRGLLTLAGSRLELGGEIKDAKALTGVDVTADLASDDPRPLLALAGRPVDSELPPLALHARLTRPASAFELSELRASWGESRVDGRLAYDPSLARPRLTGEINAPLLDIVALQPVLDSGQPTPPDPEPAGGNPLAALAGRDAEIKVTTGEIRLPQLSLRGVAATLALADDRLTVRPFRVDLPQGSIEGEASGPVTGDLVLDTVLNATGVGLAGLTGDADGYAGTVTGRLEGSLFAGPVDALLARSRLSFTGQGQGLEIPQAELSGLNLTARLADGRVTLDPLRADLPQGSVAGRVAAGPFNEQFTAELEIDATAVDLAAIARVPDVAGRLDGRLTGSLRGWNPRDLLTQSRVALTGEIDRLELPQIERGIPRAQVDASLDPDRREALRVVVDAPAGDRELKLTAFGGSARTIAENEGDYPFTVESELGNNRARVNGSLRLPITERRFAATIEVEGQDPSPMLALFELPKLQIPPYRLEGVFTNVGDELEIKDFAGRVGDSDLGADLVIDLAGERPKIVGELRSKLLDADDFGGLVGGQPGTGPGETASPGQQQEAEAASRDGTVIPNEPLDPSRWRVVDLDLDIQADEIQAGRVPLDSLTTKVRLDDGRLELQPVTIRVGDGSIDGAVLADGSRTPVRANVEMDLTRLSVARLLNRLDVDVAAFGTLSGQARGDVGVGGAGLSVKQILANSNGDVTLAMEGGRIDRTIVAAAGFDLLGVFGSLLGITSDQIELRCTLADLAIRDGVVRTETLLVDTEVADVSGQGTINLGTEQLDIDLLTRPKRTVSLPTYRTGVSIGGTLAEPEVDINAAEIAIRGAAAATIGVLAKPFTSIVGALGTGDGRGQASAASNACAQALERTGGG